MLPQRVFRRLFTELVRGPVEDVDLALAALYIAGEERPDLDVDACLATLDAIAGRVAPALLQDAPVAERLAAFGQRLLQSEGFSGDSEDRNYPRSCYLDQVLERKKGNHISLCILYKVIAARCGMVLDGIGLPGHFILCHAAGGQAVYLDPFNGGRLLTRADCEESVQSRYQGKVPFREEFLFPYDKKQMLVRLLTSLKVAYFESKEYAKALSASDRIAIIDPALSVNIRERARLYYLMGQYREAIRGLELYLKLFPEAEDKEKAREEIEALWALIATLG